MRYMARGIVVIALCSMATSCTRPDSTGPDNDIVAAGPELTAELEQLKQETLNWLDEHGAPFEETRTNLDAITEAALEGEIDVAAIDAILETIGDTEKAPLVLNHYAESVIEGLPLDQSLEPGVALGALALCNSCTTPSPLGSPDEICGFVSGQTTASCREDWYSVTLPANSACTFTTCPSGVCGSGAGGDSGFDTYLRIYSPTDCGFYSYIGYDDDGCGSPYPHNYKSELSFTTGDNDQDVVVLVTGYYPGYSWTDYGSYSLGFVCEPACNINGVMGVQQSDQDFPKATWMNRRLPRRYPPYMASSCGNNKSCPSNMPYTYYRDRPWDRWDMPAESEPTCMQVTLSNPSRSTHNPCRYTYGVAYTNTYPAGQGASCNPAPGVQWLGDSYGYAYWDYYSRSFSFNLPANTPWSLLVMNYYYTSASGGHTGCDYNVSISPCGERQTCAPRLSMSPLRASADDNCASSDAFTFDFGHTEWIPPVRLDWEIVPPAGGSASSSGGTMNITSAIESVTIPAVDFVRANCPASGVFEFNASITNNCEEYGFEPEDTLERTFQYNLVDDTPPTFLETQDICLWPPNHLALCQSPNDMVELWDNCGEEGIIVGAEVCDSDQPDDSVGDGHTVNDCLITVDDVSGEQMVCTRAERSGTIGAGNEGRNYEVRGRARDACGNFTQQTQLSSIWVPHDQREHPECITPLDF